jgi:hypothetical protein
LPKERPWAHHRIGEEGALDISSSVPEIRAIIEHSFSKGIRVDELYIKIAVDYWHRRNYYLAKDGKLPLCEPAADMMSAWDKGAGVRIFKKAFPPENFAKWEREGVTDDMLQFKHYLQVDQDKRDKERERGSTNPVVRFGKYLCGFAPIPGFFGVRKALMGEAVKACDTANEEKDI